MATLNYRMQQRRDTYANWVSEDPILLDGEIGFVTDKSYYVIGDGSTAFSSLTMVYLATVANGLYNLEDGPHDLSASSLSIDFTNLTGSINIFDQPDGFTYSVSWTGGDGTYQITFDGGTYTGKTIGGIDADTLAADIAGDGQGRITLRKDGDDLRLMYLSDDDGGNFTSGYYFTKYSNGDLRQQMFEIKDNGTTSAQNFTLLIHPAAVKSINVCQNDTSIITATNCDSQPSDVVTNGYISIRIYGTSGGTASDVARDFSAEVVGAWTTLHPVIG